MLESSSDYQLEPPDDLDLNWNTTPILDETTFNPSGDPFHLAQTDRNNGLLIGSTELRLLTQTWIRRTAVENYRSGRYRNSFRWFKKCFVKYRDPRSITCLGYIYEHGKGVRMNRYKAMECYKLGHQYGDPFGTKMVSWGYMWGLNDLPDMRKACWYNAEVKNLPYFSISHECGF